MLNVARFHWLVLGIGVLFLAGCSEMQFFMHTAKRLNKTHAGSPVLYKVGKPYQIGGVWYYPREEWDYDETGIASWYGPNFHGKKTANGETYDMNTLTAAHRTLPLPTFVRVTNLGNGRSLVLRVNDRGPFARERIIDISRRGAQLLGFQKQGTARVRVQILLDKSRALAARLRNEALLAEIGSPIKAEAMPKPKVSAEFLPPPPGGAGASATPVSQPAVARSGENAAERNIWQATVYSPEDARVTTHPVLPTRIFVQAGAYAYFDSANRARAVLSGIGPVDIYQALVNGKDLYRVRVGPLAEVGQADQALKTVIQAGYTDARIVVD